MKRYGENERRARAPGFDRPSRRAASAKLGSIFLCAMLLAPGLAFAAVAAPAAPAPTGMLDALQRDMLVLKEQLRLMFAAYPHLAEIGPFVLQRLTKGYGPDHIWRILFELAGIFVGAGLGEALAHRLFRPLHQLLPTLGAQSDFGKLGALLVNALIRLLELAAFGIIAICLSFVLFEGHEAARYAFWSLFFLVLLVRMMAIGLRVLLAPHLPALRLPDLDDATARRLYRRSLFLAAWTISTGVIAAFLYDIGLSTDLQMAAGELLLVIATAVIIAMIWRERRPIASWIGFRLRDDAAKRKDLAGVFAAQWHVFASCFLVAMAILASLDRLVTGERQAGRIFSTLAILLALPVIDGLMRMIVRSYFAPPESEVAAAAEEGYGVVILRNGRIALAVIAAILVARIWHIDFSGLGAGGLGPRIAEALFQIVITLLLASSAWGIVKVAINRHLPRERLDALALVGEEAPGSGLSRLETLLPLVRMFLFVTIVAMALMSVVSALGVNIGPLLAGAGIVGVAVGFGSQTLVRDILSGVFFLFDDAFRIGEYIDVGEGKGTVERMSIRALMLRHQAGQIYTIPFGAIRRVANYSRDWTIMKLEVRVPFDTDLEKLRKVVKRAGEELAADPEFGAMFLQPLKSQGVNRIDDSAFVIRVKFMARPTGDAFILRRQVFQRIQEAFQKNGIAFASRRVVVEEADEHAGSAAEVTLLTPAEERRNLA